MSDIPAKLQQQHATSEEWAQLDIVLLEGELGVQEYRLKVGDGTTQWSGLPFITPLPAPDDDQYYGHQGDNIVEVVGYEEFTGDLNGISSVGVREYKLVPPISNAWVGYSDTDGSFMTHRGFGDGTMIQTGYTVSPSTGVTPVIQSRFNRNDGAGWSEWNSQVVFSAEPYTGDMRALSDFGGVWAATFSLSDSASNTPPNVGIYAVATHLQQSDTRALQYIIDQTNASSPAIWTSFWESGTGWSDWASINGRGSLMTWRGVWQQGETYYKGDSVDDEGFFAVANKLTTDKAAPQSIGGEFSLYNGTWPTIQETAKQIIVGQQYTKANDGVTAQITGYKLHTTIGNVYSAYFIQDPGGANIITQLLDFTGTVDGEFTVKIDPVFLTPDVPFQLLVVSYEPDPTPVIFSFDYVYSTQGGGGGDRPPVSGELLQADQNNDELRVHYFDNGGVDRSAQLATMSIGDRISGVGVTWSIQDIRDEGTWYAFVVAPVTQGTPDGLATFDFETVNPTPITHVEDVNYWDATNDPDDLIKGIKRVDEAATITNDNAYGVDLILQEVEASPDWDLPGLGGVTATGGTGSEFTERFIDPSGEASYEIKGNQLTCWGTTATATSDAVLITYPKAFTSRPWTSADALVTSLTEGQYRCANVDSTWGSAETVMRARAFNPATQTASTRRIKWQAIGQWDGN